MGRISRGIAVGVRPLNSIVRRHTMLPSVGNWQMEDLAVPERFSAFAWAYLKASSRACEAMESRPDEHGFPDANVVLMLAAHSIELFLKGMILQRDASFNIVTHNLNDLHRRFDELYPEPECRWELPFGTEYPGFPEQEIIALQKTEVPPSIRYRYPTDNSKQIWAGIHSFTPYSFLLTLQETEAMYSRIEGAV